MKLLVRLAGLAWPFVAVPVFGWLLAESYLNLGGGEKDILLVGPAALFGLIYTIGYAFFWVKASRPLKAFGYSVGLALVVLGAAFVTLYLYTVWSV